MKRILHVNQDTLNALLPDLPPDFEAQMQSMLQSMPAERKEPKMRKKLSLGLVMALVLALLAIVGALAATLLGGKDFVDQVVAPKAAENASRTFSQEEVNEILRIAKENELYLDDDIVDRLARYKGGYWKEELMRLFVKAEYGFYPAAWPLEIQKWYEEMLVATGLQDGKAYAVVPEGDEISLETALQIARETIEKKAGGPVALDDPQTYLRLTTYQERVVNPYLTTREWYICFEPQDLYATEYELTLDTRGNVLTFQAWAGIDGGSQDMPGFCITDRFTRVYGPLFSLQGCWTMDQLRAYQAALTARYEKEGELGLTSQEMRVVQQTYLTPEGALLSADEAVKKARAACQPALVADAAFPVCIQGEKGPVWKVSLHVFTDRAQNVYRTAFVQLDAKTGEIQACDTALDSACPLWRSLVTEAYWEAHKPQDALACPPLYPTARPDGKPWLWYSDLGPDWYWRALDQVGYPEKDGVDLYQYWQQTYGEDMDFWPLEAQAIMALYHDLYDAGTASIPGLPGEKDLSRELAVKLAREAFQTQYADRIENLDVDAWHAAVSFNFHAPDLNSNQWVIRLKDDQGAMKGYVDINATTAHVDHLEAYDLPRSVVDLYEGTPISTPTPRPDGKPWMWGGDFAPQSFWLQLEKMMDQKGITFENCGQFFYDWEQEYGDVAWWPQDCLALYHILDLDEKNLREGYYAAFPKEGGISQDRAKEIAEAELRQLCEENGLEAAWADTLRPSAVLWHNEPITEKTCWFVQFFEYDYDTWNTRVIVYVSEDGEVLTSYLNLNSNG